MGSRAIYHDGWMASATGPRLPWVPGRPPGIEDWTPDQDQWRLYNLDEDWTQAHDLAGQMPDKPAQMKETFAIEAARNSVYPIGGGLWVLVYHPELRISTPYREWNFGPEIVPAAGAGKRSRRAYETSVGTSQDRQRNALIVSMLAYAGLRPIEDRGCTWGDLRDRTLHVFATKTSRPRDVDLIAPLAQDLAEWRMACGRPQDDELVIPRPSRGQWTREDLANWRRRVRRPAAIEAGVTGDLRPYRLRGSFVSLLLWEGHSLTYVAEQAGHSIATLARHYAGAGNQAPRPGG